MVLEILLFAYANEDGALHYSINPMENANLRRATIERILVTFISRALQYEARRLK